MAKPPAKKESGSATPLNGVRVFCTASALEVMYFEMNLPYLASPATYRLRFQAQLVPSSGHVRFVHHRDWAYGMLDLKSARRSQLPTAFSISSAFMVIA